MAPSLLFDLSDIDLTEVAFDTRGIERINPHRGPMRQIDRIVWEDYDSGRIVAAKDVRHDEFWVEGHVPGRPLFPGVLMIEAAAQVASFNCLRRIAGGFMGFTRCDDARFRGQVAPGCTFYILCEQLEFRARRSVCRTQGVVEGNLVFEAVITGMPM